MKWFGTKPWGPLCKEVEQVPTPVNERCARCDEPILASEDGLVIPHLGGPDGPVDHPYHWECQMRAIVGGYNHQRGRCFCCGGDQPPDPPDMTRREAAKLAVTAFGQRRAPPTKDLQ